MIKNAVLYHCHHHVILKVISPCRMETTSLVTAFSLLPLWSSLHFSAAAALLLLLLLLLLMFRRKYLIT